MKLTDMENYKLSIMKKSKTDYCKCKRPWFDNIDECMICGKHRGKKLNEKYFEK